MEETPMQKHAAATALAIGLINIAMLTPAVSASTHYCQGTVDCACAVQCDTKLWNTAKLWDRTSLKQAALLRDACMVRCVRAKEAAQH
jgi:hypothetical protein